ncbi:MAG: pyridoxal 5'-phosphate synthase glutaminase subunit PdxT [Terracidiphilus sp.]|jgi:5'-phosphate synthase pdxT subunit
MTTIAATANLHAPFEVASSEKPTVGVLAVQGNFEAHARAFQKAGARAVLVRKAAELDGLDGLAMPGGESTTMLRFLERDGFIEVLREFLSVTPCFATCAGCILLAREVLSPAQASLGLLDIAVERNAYGRQIDSTILTQRTELPGGPLEMVFIRAPRITRTGTGVEVLARRDGSPTLVRQGHLVAATFHPEMTADLRVQGFFLDLVRAHRSAKKRPSRKDATRAGRGIPLHSKLESTRALARIARRLVAAD